jgi:hypothetical protein
MPQSFGCRQLPGRCWSYGISPHFDFLFADGPKTIWDALSQVHMLVRLRNYGPIIADARIEL